MGSCPWQGRPAHLTWGPRLLSAPAVRVVCAGLHTAGLVALALHSAQCISSIHGLENATNSADAASSSLVFGQAWWHNLGAVARGDDPWGQTSRPPLVTRYLDILL